MILGLLFEVGIFAVAMSTASGRFMSEVKESKMRSKLKELRNKYAGFNRFRMAIMPYIFPISAISQFTTLIILSFIDPAMFDHHTGGTGGKKNMETNRIANRESNRTL